MQWSEDDLDLPIEKPIQLVNLEKMGSQRLDAMTDVEAEERIEEAAYAIAHNYHQEIDKGNYEECVATVSILMNTTGAAIGSKVGGLMVAKSDSLAKLACRLVFPTESTEY